VPGVGPGALADPTGFVGQLADVGITARVETEELGFDFPDFELAWEVLAGVTTAQLAPERRQEAKEAVTRGGLADRHLGRLDPTQAVAAHEVQETAAVAAERAHP
jgi:hypothetical protein